jgi:hypothetical protein
MPMDNQLSTVLLLVALGFIIYYLTKPTEGFASEQTTTQEQNMVPETARETVAEVKPEMLNQILAESEIQTGTSKSSQGEIRGDQLDVFSFEPNDIKESGASLDDAFEKPIPPQARPDAIDINKNNVKKYDAKDFLPKEVNDQWFDTDFSQAKVNVNDDKLINTERYVIGINTVGQSLKNASYDIRGTIPNPKYTVSPWNNSTYEADYNIKPLC